VPSAIAVTKPADETVAADESDDDHVTVAPEMVVPAASLTVALSVAVSPTDAKVFVLGDNATLDATWVTVTEADPLAEPDVAVIVADPVATDVTRPADDTVATVVSEDAHVTVAPEMVVPAASLTVALSVAVSPTDAKASVLGDNATLDATWVTVTEADPDADPEVAITEADPVATVVTNPTDETVATPVFVEDQVIVGLEITVPPASFTVAASVAVSPTDVNVFVLGDSATLDAT